MTALEFFLIVLVWLFTAGFICHKRKWYKLMKSDAELSAEVACVLAFI